MGDAEVTNRLALALRKLYPQTAYALLYEVGNGTGGRNKGWADAVVMSLWPSRGLTLTGFEIKASRPDWIRERDKPEKAERVMRYCDGWYLLTEPGVIRDIAEIPDAWGWMERDGAKPSSTALVTRKQAPKLSAAPMDRTFLAALLRRAGQVSDTMITEAVGDRTREVREEAIRDGSRRYEESRAAHERLIESVTAFERATGVCITNANFGSRYGAIGAVAGAREGAAYKAYKHFLEMMEERYAELGQIERACASLQGSATALRQQVEAVLGASQNEVTSA